MKAKLFRWFLVILLWAGLSYYTGKFFQWFGNGFMYPAEFITLKVGVFFAVMIWFIVFVYIKAAIDDAPTLEEHEDRAIHAKIMKLGPCEKLVYQEDVQEYLDCGWEILK